MDKQREEEIARFWKENNIYQKIKKARSAGKKFYFLDGPPYATGSIHIGTAWNKILKDTYIRFWRMSGYDVWDQPGYDTHGIPIENKVEKELQLRAKHDIEKMGIEKFILSCRRFATEHIETMNQQFSDLGVWMDWSNPYLTLSNEYIEGAWHTFKVGFDKGLLYHSSYSVHVCPHCETAVAYNEIEYAKLTDPSIYVKFPVSGKNNEYLVIWTTTPWTLPSNTGIMANPEADYVKLKIDEQVLIIAKGLVAGLMDRIGASKYVILEEIKGRNLEGMRYSHPLSDIFSYLKDIKNAHRVVLSDQYVSLEEGTGLVHTAPGHGKEDYIVGIQNGLPVINPLKMNGTYNDKCGQFSGVFAKHADRKIIDLLKGRGLLLCEENVTHDYPQCWRCNSPLLQMAVPQWFFRVTTIRDKLLEENEKVNWYPEWAKQRFQNWLENLGDWPISRQRYWGIPLPIWICDSCQNVKVVGSKEELPHSPEDLHRPYIDGVIIKCICGGKMKRIPDVLDVWFDSGLAAWASLGYPKNKDAFERLFPSDFQTEGPDQFRGWWNSEIITSVITFDRAPFKNILLHGFVLDAHGSKMSKSKGNVVMPEDVIKKYGRDVLRYYLLSSPPWEDFYFKWVGVEDIAKSFTIIENTFNFIKTYAITSEANRVKLNCEDEWILSRLNSLIADCTENFKAYNAHKSAVEIHNFIVNDFSRWYIKLVRDRVWPAYDGSDKEAAFYTLFEVAKNVTRLFAPICPFMTEHIYQNVLKGKNESIHLCGWPVADKERIDSTLERRMNTIREIVETANSLRQEKGVKLRWPLSTVRIECSQDLTGFSAILRSMCNVKHVIFEEIEGGVEFSDGKILLDTELTDELKEEALLREIVRKIQDMRKKSKLVVKDKIILKIHGADEIGKYDNKIKDEVGAEKILHEKSEGETLVFEGRQIRIDIKKL